MSVNELLGEEPLFLGEDPGEEELPSKKARRLLFLGGNMTAMGNMGLAYPLLLDPMDGGEEEDPNP